MNCNDQICYNIMTSYFKWRHSTRYGRIPFTPWIMLKTCVLYTSHKIHPLLKFIEIDGISVNLHHSYSKAEKNSKNFKKLQLYIWCFSPCYRNVPRRLCFCVCICWLFQFSCLAYISLHKKRFAAFHLSRADTVFC